jgi:hypothetical protein
MNDGGRVKQLPLKKKPGVSHPPEFDESTRVLGPKTQHEGITPEPRPASAEGTLPDVPGPTRRLLSALRGALLPFRHGDFDE